MKHERTTWGFVQAGLDVQTSAVFYLAFVRAGRTSLNFCCYLHQQFFNQQRFRAGRSMNTSTAASPAR